MFIIGKLFRSARRISDAFHKTFLSNPDNTIVLDEDLLHNDYEQHIDFAQSLYEQYQNELLEIIGSYGFSNEVDLFCCIDSCNMKANERSDIQQTARTLLKAVFQAIKQKFDDNIDSNHDAKAKASACYYVAYTDKSGKDKQMLSFPWLFASKLLADVDVVSIDEKTSAIMEHRPQLNPDLYCYLIDQCPFLVNLLANNFEINLKEIFQICLQNACSMQDESWISNAELLIEQVFNYCKD